MLAAANSQCLHDSLTTPTHDALEHGSGLRLSDRALCPLRLSPKPTDLPLFPRPSLQAIQELTTKLAAVEATHRALKVRPSAVLALGLNPSTTKPCRGCSHATC
jgi:hypothetical protein